MVDLLSAPPTPAPAAKTMRVARYNYPLDFGEGIGALTADLQRMLLAGRYVLTEEVARFEAAFAEYVGVRHVRGVNSGTDALILALMALGIGPGDEVVTHANTFHATVAAICLVGATPVLVDADDRTWEMDAHPLDAAVTPRTRVLMPVHLFGKPGPMEAVMAVAARHGLRVVEDAAQSHGARVGGRRTGSLGDVSAFSFHPSKNLAAAGDGGAIATDDPEIAAAVERLRSLGQSGQNHHVAVGYNSKLHAIQARILEHKLPSLDRWNAARRQAARGYRERLADLPLRFQPEDAGEEHVYHLFQVRTDRRDALLQHLVDAGVDATLRYPAPIHLQPAFADRGWRPGQFPVAERLAAELLTLPIRPDLSADEQDYVAERIRAFFGAGGA